MVNAAISNGKCSSKEWELQRLIMVNGVTNNGKCGDK